MTERHRPLALIILDGWGYSESPEHNAIYAANTPVWDALWQNHSHMLINASGTGVGLPGDQMGNSEVGHMNMGAGRVVYQDFTRLGKAIETGSFYDNPTLCKAVDKAVEKSAAVHILGLLSDGGVHSHETHLQAMVKLAAQRGATKIYVHGFLDGRDTSPKSAHQPIANMEACFAEVGAGRFASVIGRFYAMDRDKRWNRVEKAYHLIAEGESEFQADSAKQALDIAYSRDETDEFVKATTIGTPVRVEEGDSIVFMNFRSDRARELTQCFIEADFADFERPRTLQLSDFVTLTEYKKDFDAPIAFPPEKLTNMFGDYISVQGLRQLRIAETEKYAHVTFFFNGGRDAPYEGEDRILIPSPKVDTYDLQPEMSAPEVAEKLVDAINSQQYDVIICNFANPDMVGHTGNFAAAVKAVETVDECVGKIWAALQAVGGEMIITADHGNVEKMVDECAGQAHTAHTSNLVPLLFAGRQAVCADSGNLSDIAPTMLTLLDLPIPLEMSQHQLFKV